jgi:proteasome assembly chaperone (PAC2) family protein
MPCNCKKNKIKEVKQDLDALKARAQELEKLIEEIKSKNTTPDKKAPQELLLND